eukprot:scaffold11490_cov67-Phaeocystis_antarctica.AAC.6
MAVASARRRAHCEPAAHFTRGEAEPRSVHGVSLLVRECAAVEHLRIRAEVATQVGADAVGAVRVAAVAGRGTRVDGATASSSSPCATTSRRAAPRPTATQTAPSSAKARYASAAEAYQWLCGVWCVYCTLKSSPSSVPGGMPCRGSSGPYRSDAVRRAINQPAIAFALSKCASSNTAAAPSPPAYEK